MSDFDIGGRKYDIPEVPPGAKRLTSIVIVLIIVAVAGLVVINMVSVRVPAGFRGVVLTFGAVEDRILPEGLSFIVPVSQSVVFMNVQIQKTESTEVTATQDLQEVSTTVAVNFRLEPSRVNIIYQDLRQDYVFRVIQPIIQETLKATTAQYRAEELVTKRAQVKITLDGILEERLRAYNIQVITVSLTDFRFGASFTTAIDAKVIAEQQALQAKNVLEQVKYEAQQIIIQAEAQKNATIARAEGDALAQVIEATANAEAIQLITQQMTDEYAQYLYLERWDGQLPAVVSGNDQDFILDISDLIKKED